MSRRSLARVLADRHPPWRELSWPRRARRAGGWLLLVSSGAMAVAAATASSDWDVTSESNGATR